MVIETIGLDGMLPEVFLGASIPPSQIWNCSVQFRRGAVYWVEAASGGGKSSLCSFIYGSRRDFSGKLFFNGLDASGLRIEGWQELRRCHLAYLPQELDLFPELTALENVELKNRLTGHSSGARIGEWFDTLGIGDKRNVPAGRLSVGQQQRVAIIRALCQPFDFLLLDEPVSHLDPENNAAVAAVIKEEAGRQGAGVIATSVGNPLQLPPDATLQL